MLGRGDWYLLYVVFFNVFVQRNLNSVKLVIYFFWIIESYTDVLIYKFNHNENFYIELFNVEQYCGMNPNDIW